MAESVNICVLSESIAFFVILNIVNPNFIIIMYYLELKPNSYEIKIYI
jgi:hypothetical protein